jgi:hypothetical protein
VRIAPLLLSVPLPGAGHLWLRRHGAGTSLAGLFAISLNALLLSSLWQGEEVSRALWTSGLCGAAATWAAALAHVGWLTIGLGRAASCARRDDLVRKALLAHLAGRHGEAVADLDRALRLCAEGADPDIDFLLGAIARRGGHARRARRHLERCLRHDTAGKWRWEAEAELAALRRGDPPPPRARPLPRGESGLTTLARGLERLEVLPPRARVG